MLTITNTELLDGIEREMKAHLKAGYAENAVLAINYQQVELLWKRMKELQAKARPILDAALYRNPDLLTDPTWNVGYTLDGIALTVQEVRELATAIDPFLLDGMKFKEGKE